MGCTLQLLAVSACIAQEVRETLTIMVEDAAAPWSRSDGTGYAKEAPINLPQPCGKLKIPLNLALLTAKYPVRAALASLSAHFSVLRA